MSSAVLIARLSSGLFFIVGLLSGFWKYRAMITARDGRAPVYIDICHRSALMYAFACLVLAEFAELSVWPPVVNTVGVVAPIGFFASAVLLYGIHGALRDTDNMLARPHRLGRNTLPGALVSAYIYLLVAAELGGFLVLFSGALQTMF